MLCSNLMSPLIYHLFKSHEDTSKCPHGSDPQSRLLSKSVVQIVGPLVKQISCHWLNEPLPCWWNLLLTPRGTWRNKWAFDCISWSQRVEGWGGSSIKCHLWFDPLAGPGQLEAPHCLPCAWNALYACLPQARSGPRTQPWDRNVVTRLLDWVRGWTLLRPLHKLLRFGTLMQKTTHFAVTQDKPTKYVPSLIKIRLFFSLSLPSVRELVSDFTWEAPKEVESQQKHHGFAWVHVEFRFEHNKAPDIGKEEICLYKTFPDTSGWKWSSCLPIAISVASII